jgi:hypothetical protein
VSGTPTPHTTVRYTYYRPRKDAAERLKKAFEPENPADVEAEQQINV